MSVKLQNIPGEERQKMSPQFQVQLVICQVGKVKIK